VVTVTAARQADGPWQCCVTDNGIGIPPEFAEKIFVIFQRLHGRDAYPGTGIGLALCKRIVEQHGGDMYLDTSHTGGTRICFTLPLAPAADPAAGPTDTTSSAEGIPA
jgi:signal transduction histidine kinase